MAAGVGEVASLAEGVCYLPDGNGIYFSPLASARVGRRQQAGVVDVGARRNRNVGDAAGLALQRMTIGARQPMCGLYIRAAIAKTSSALTAGR